MEYLKATSFLDYKNEEIQQLVAEFKSDRLSDKEKAIGLYLKIREGWYYNALNINLTKEGYVASKIALQSEGHCVTKSLLLVACLRAVGIPSRLRLAKVKNHIAVDRLIEQLGADVLTPHGMLDVYLNGKWVKCCPAFNSSLCEKFKVAPLDFDGENDSMFQEYNSDDQKFMEYIEDYGAFEDVPVDFMFANLREHYPKAFQKINGKTEIRF